MMEMESSTTSTNGRLEQFVAVQNEARELFSKKNADYGDAFATYGPVGILVRMGDKIQRLQTITNTGINLVNDEGLRDTLIDLHNYAAMAVMLLDEKNVGNQLDNLVLETKPICKTWKIRGSSGSYYERRHYIDTNMGDTESCTCPSFTYCKSLPRTCKHITNTYSEFKET